MDRKYKSPAVGRISWGQFQRKEELYTQFVIDVWEAKQPSGSCKVKEITVHVAKSQLTSCSLKEMGMKEDWRMAWISHSVLQIASSLFLWESWDLLSLIIYPDSWVSLMKHHYSFGKRIWGQGAIRPTRNSHSERDSLWAGWCLAQKWSNYAYVLIHRWEVRISSKYFSSRLPLSPLTFM